MKKKDVIADAANYLLVVANMLDSWDVTEGYSVTQVLANRRLAETLRAKSSWVSKMANRRKRLAYTEGLDI